MKTTDAYFMEKALNHAQQAYDLGEFPVGCIVVVKNDIIATGSRFGTKEQWPNEIDHAEMVALRKFSKQDVKVDPDQTTLYCTLEPCLMCFGAILLCGISRVVFAYEDVMGGGTRCDLNTMPPLYRNRSISIIGHILRAESIELFKAYFSNPRNIYCRGTLLAEYTLAQ